MIVQIWLLSNRVFAHNHDVYCLKVLGYKGLSVFLSFGDLLKESGGSFDTD